MTAKFFQLVQIFSSNHSRQEVHDYFLLLFCKSSIWFTEKHIFKIIVNYFNTSKCTANYVISFEAMKAGKMAIRPWLSCPYNKHTLVDLSFSVQLVQFFSSSHCSWGWMPFFQFHLRNNINSGLICDFRKTLVPVIDLSVPPLQTFVITQRDESEFAPWWLGRNTFYGESFLGYDQQQCNALIKLGSRCDLRL